MTHAMTMRAADPRTLIRIGIVALLLAALVTVVGPAAHPARVEATTTAEYMEGLLVSWINNARANKGLPRLTVGDKLTDYAGERAAQLASANKLSHPSCLGCQLNTRDISWTTCAEVVAGTTYPWGYDAALSIYRSWKGSSGHWATLMSRSYKRFGVGVAYRSSNKTTFAAAVLAGG